MSLKNKFLRSVMIGTVALGLFASISAPARAADNSDVVIGLIGGLFIAGALYQSQRRRNRNGYVTSGARGYNYSRYNRGYRSEYNRYGHEGRYRNQYDHGRHNRYRNHYHY